MEGGWPRSGRRARPRSPSQAEEESDAERIQGDSIRAHRPYREETYEAGDAYSVPPGHPPVHYAGTEIVEFSPTEILGERIPVVLVAGVRRGNRLGRMARVEAARRYDVPVESGFAFITDTANWSRFWPGYVRLEPGSSWGASGDTARLVTRLLGRERQLTMTIGTFEPNRLVTYTSTQPGLPDAYHERRFEPDSHGFVYRLVVEYEPRGGIAGVFDRALLMRGIRRAFERTFAALERELVRAR